MKSIDKFVLVLVASLALLLAGCGGGSSTPAPTPDPTPPPSPPDYSGQLLMHHQAAVEATAKAEGAGMAAADALESAEESEDMLTTTQVGGDSSKAMMNAQAILDAKDDVAQAVMDAEMAKMDAMEAKTAAGMVPDGTAGKAQAIAALDAAIKVAEAEIKKAAAIRDGRDLDDAVFGVVGANGKGTPRSIADAVGMDIAGSVSPGATPNAAGRARGTHTNDISGTGDGTLNAAAAGHKHQANDAQGKTWAEIAGEDNVMKMRLGAIAADGTHTLGNGVLSVASIAGMTAADVAPTGTDFSSTGNTDGAVTASSNYMGIPGAVFCLGGSDGCKVTDGKLGAGWYFSPGSPKANYIRNPNRETSEDTPYIMETMYAQYGYWLAPNSTDATLWDVNTFSTSAVTASGDITTVGTEDNELEDSATYSGSAVGMSVHKTPKAGGGSHIDSGMFTADVMLTAKFGAAATISGTIDNFQGDAVGSGWSVRLDTPTTGVLTTGSGIAVASGVNGVWSAIAYGSAGKRPSGIHGGFSAHFLDGHAAGAYATLKD